MLTRENRIGTFEDAKQSALQDSARFDDSPVQLELMFPADLEDFSNRAPPVEEDPIIRRLHNGPIQSADEWIRLIAEGFELSAHKSKRRDNLREEVELAFSRFLKSVTGVIAQPVVMFVAPDQPLHHEKFIPCPTYCPVYRFGPTARGPPRRSRR